MFVRSLGSATTPEGKENAESKREESEVGAGKNEQRDGHHRTNDENERIKLSRSNGHRAT